MKLHLGCGQYKLEGYHNIDYPLSEHSVQIESIADEHADLLALNYSVASISEVRLHHVFEHFTRAHTCALLASWNSWLSIKGKVRIEVPDFQRTAKAVIGIFADSKAQSVGLRHIFGSQEAHWANHYEGYTIKRLQKLTELFGYRTLETSKNEWMHTYNIEIIVEKVRSITRKESEEAAKKYLSSFMVDDSESEQKLLAKWMDDFNLQLQKSYAKNA